MRIYCGRSFSPDDIQGIRNLIEQDPTLRRTSLSRKLCELWSWIKPNGELKDMTCRVALARMQVDGLITLPPSQLGVLRRRPHFAPTAASEPQSSVTAPVHELAAITIRAVKGTASSRLWNEYVARYSTTWATPRCQARRCATTSTPARSWWHASALVPAPGSSRSGSVSSDGKSTSAKKNLQLVVNNARLPDPVLDPQQGSGIQDLGAVCASTPPRLAAPLRLLASTTGDLR